MRIAGAPLRYVWMQREAARLLEDAGADFAVFPNYLAPLASLRSFHASNFKLHVVGVAGRRGRRHPAACSSSSNNGNSPDDAAGNTDALTHG